MRKYDNPMSRQVFSLPDLIRDQYIDLEPKTRTVLTTPEIFNVQRIILTGCGDSYAAGMATKYAFEMLTGIPTEAVPAIDLSRFYYSQHLGIDCRNPLVIVVSNSGKVARISEAAQRARHYGCFVLGVTGNPSSQLGIYSDKVLKLDIPDFEDAPGTRSYAVSIMALLLLAIRFGEVRGRYTMDTAMDIRMELSAQGTLLEKLLTEMEETTESLAEEWKNLECFDFIGSGFDYATAWFGYCKALEATGRYAMHINSEEWFHINFFARKVGSIGTVVVGNTTSPGFSRTKELVHFANTLGRPLAVISNGSKDDFGEAANYIKVPSPKYPILMPLTQFAPICLLMGYIAQIIGESYGRNCEGPWSFAKDGAGVQKSQIIIK